MDSHSGMARRAGPGIHEHGPLEYGFRARRGAAPRNDGLWLRRRHMHPILEEFCDKWVWPTMPGAPGAEFRLKLTREQCLKGWGILLERNLRDIEEELASNDEEWKRQHALRGYAAEGVQMSIKQMSAQLLSVDIGDQENYIDLQRMRARQIWDECKHSKLHDEELMHFMEGKFQLDFYCTTPESQKHVEDTLGYLLHQIGGFGTSPQPAAAK